MLINVYSNKKDTLGAPSVRSVSISRAFFSCFEGIIPIFAQNHIKGDGGEDDIDPRPAHTHEPYGEEAHGRAEMEGKQGKHIKPKLFEMPPVAVGDILGKRERGLLCVVC